MTPPWQEAPKEPLNTQNTNESTTINDLNSLKTEVVSSSWERLTESQFLLLEQRLKARWININSPFKVTKEQLINLKSTLEKPNADKVGIVESFIMNEYLETDIESKWVWAFTLDNLLVWVDNPRILENRHYIEAALEWFLSKYDFLDNERKEIIKITILSKFLDKSMWWWDIIGSFVSWVSEVTAKKDSNISISWIKDKFDEISQSATSIESNFKKYIWEYSSIFDSVSQKLEWIPNEIKKSIISNVEWFKNPKLIEAWISTFNLDSIDINNTTQNDNFDINLLKDYFLNSRKKVESLSSLFEKWDTTADMLYSLSSKWWPIWEAVDWILWFILKLPFIWKLIAWFLWLDLNDPMKDFTDSKGSYELFKWLVSLWTKSSSDWNKIAWKWVFENISLSWINFNVVKKEFKEIKTLFSDIKVDNYQDFWLTLFSDEWIEKDWVIFKLNLTQEHLSNEKISTKDLKDIINEWLNNYKNEVSRKSLEKELENQSKDNIRLESQRQEQLSKAQASKESISSFNSQLLNINRIISWDYIKIDQWSWVWWNIKSIKISDLIKNDSDDFSLLISNNLHVFWSWKNIWDDYKKISENDKILLNLLMLFIRDYVKAKWTNWTLTIGIFLEKNKGSFDKYLKEKKQLISWNLETEDSNLSLLESSVSTSNDKLEFANFKSKVFEVLNWLWNWVKLSDWVDIWNWKVIKFDKNSNKLQIWDKYYSLEISRWEDKYNLSDIVSDKNTFIFIPEFADTLNTSWIQKYTNENINNQLSKKIVRWDVLIILNELLNNWSLTKKFDDITLSIKEIKS